MSCSALLQKRCHVEKVGTQLHIWVCVRQKQHSNKSKQFCFTHQRCPWDHKIDPLRENWIVHSSVTPPCALHVCQMFRTLRVSPSLHLRNGRPYQVFSLSLFRTAVAKSAIFFATTVIIKPEKYWMDWKWVWLACTAVRATTSGLYIILALHHLVAKVWDHSSSCLCMQAYRCQAGKNQSPQRGFLHLQHHFSCRWSVVAVRLSPVCRQLRALVTNVHSWFRVMPLDVLEQFGVFSWCLSAMLLSNWFCWGRLKCHYQ